MKILTYLIAIVVVIYKNLFQPLFIQLKVIALNITHLRHLGEYKYTNYNGGLTIFKPVSKEQVDKLFAIYEIPDKNMFTSYWRIFHRLEQFTIGLSFDDYLEILGDNKFLLISAKIKNYKSKYINNLKFKTNYERSKEN